MRSCLDSLVQEMEYHDGGSPVEAPQACQEDGACDIVTYWKNCVSSYLREEAEGKQEQMLLVFTTA